MKELDIRWPRFNIYLSLNTGIAIAAGFLLKDYLGEPLLNLPLTLLIIWVVLFFIGRYLANIWERVNRDDVRWQLLIEKHIALLEPYLFDKREGLYTSILKEYEATKRHQEDVTDLNIKLAQFFFWLWSVALLFSTILVVYQLWII